MRSRLPRLRHGPRFPYGSRVRVALLADTHLPSLIRQLDELGTGPGELLATADLILHAGDVTAPSVLDWCEAYAPVLVAQGNNDIFEDRRLAERQLLDLEGWRLGMTHELRPESRPISVLLEEGLGGERVDVLVAGDTHVERLEFRDGVLFVNPGSPTLPHHKEYRLGTAAVLDIERDRIRAEVVLLGETEGSPNPGTASAIEIARSRDDGRVGVVA